MRPPTMEPYLWYDPHEIIKNLEWKIFALKFKHQYEFEDLKELINKEISQLSSEHLWQI